LREFVPSFIIMKISVVVSAVVAFCLCPTLVSAAHVRGGNDDQIKQRELGYYDWYSFGCERTMVAHLADPSARRLANKPAAPAAAVSGTVTFSCSEDWYYNDHMTQVDYKITGLTPGLHGFHVHESRIGTGGDMTCGSTGGHWNPDGMDHGTNLDWQRHIGDMGNILADENGVAEGSLLAYIPLKGEYGTAMRAVVVHGGTDDLGLGGNNDSRANGNAGARVACGDVRNSKYYEK
jgi:superoxide dismutase, Cu-Zn family